MLPPEYTEAACVLSLHTFQACGRLLSRSQATGSVLRRCAPEEEKSP